MNPEPSAKSTGALVGDILQQMTRLVRGEMALAKVELEENVRKAGMGIAMLVVAGTLGMSSLNVIAAACVMALVDRGMTPGLAALAISSLFAVVALIIGIKGLSTLKASSLKPDRTLQNVRRDAATIKEFVDNDSSQ